MPKFESRICRMRCRSAERSTGYHQTSANGWCKSESILVRVWFQDMFQCDRSASRRGNRDFRGGAIGWARTAWGIRRPLVGPTAGAQLPRVSSKQPTFISAHIQLLGFHWGASKYLVGTIIEMFLLNKRVNLAITLHAWKKREMHTRICLKNFQVFSMGKMSGGFLDKLTDC